MRDPRGPSLGHSPSTQDDRIHLKFVIGNLQLLIFGLVRSRAAELKIKNLRAKS